MVLILGMCTAKICYAELSCNLTDGGENALSFTSRIVWSDARLNGALDSGDRRASRLQDMVADAATGV